MPALSDSPGARPDLRASVLAIAATVRRAISAGPDLALGATFLWTWVHPASFAPGMLSYLTLTMLLEFVVIHSSAVMGVAAYADGPRLMRTAAIGGLGAFYSIFVAAFAAAFKTWWPFWTFWGLTLNRLSSVILGTAAGEDKAAVAAGWALSVVLYIGGAFATVFLPIPRFGMSADLVPTLGVPGGGLWVDEPQRLLAFGALYFLCQGFAELYKS